MNQYITGLALFLFIAGLWALIYFIAVKGISTKTFRLTGFLSLIFLIIIIGTAILAVGIFLDYHENPKFCGTTCHPMEPYYESYLNPGNNSIMLTHVEHDIPCISCHTGPGLAGQMDPFLNAPRESINWLTGNYDPDNLHGFVPTENCMKGCHDEMDWLIEAPAPRDSDFTVINGSTVWPTIQIWHPFTNNGTDFSILEAREECVDCHDHRMNGIGYTRDACLTCHDLTEDEQNLHRDQTCGMEDCHEDPEFIGHRSVMDNCMFCHDRQHPEDARVPYTIAQEHGIYEMNSTFCSACHVDEFNTFINQESKHGSDTGCPDCHEEHKQHPNCMDCHEELGVNHTVTGIYADCVSCHKSGGHDPLDIPFDGQSLPVEFCGECHDVEYNIFTHSLTQHRLDQNCSDCHTSHRGRSSCDKCHNESNMDHETPPFQEECTECHQLGAHNPLEINIQNKSEITESFCGNCHEPVVIRKQQGPHNALDCITCHDNWASWEIDFDFCRGSCHPSMPEWKSNDLVGKCILCHDTSKIHTDPILIP